MTIKELLSLCVNGNFTIEVYKWNDACMHQSKVLFKDVTSSIDELFFGNQENKSVAWFSEFADNLEIRYWSLRYSSDNNYPYYSICVY